MRSKKVFIVILNWNSWANTIECLESIFRTCYPDYHVIVCDNNSQDNSMENIKAWANGTLNIFVSYNNPLKHLSSPPIRKPVSYIEYSNQAAIQGENKPIDTRLILINNGANLGFAGGCNVAIRYALARNDFDYIWLLNNDTVVEATALEELILKMGEKPHAGMCGSTLLFYCSVCTIQALGGAYYNKWLALPQPVGVNNTLYNDVDENELEHKLTYIAGASILVSKDFISKIGLLSEDYFLFFEEIDWAVRAQGMFTMAYASKSIVYHKEGSSIGTSSKTGKNSPLSEYYFNKNRIKFTKKYYPWALPTVLLAILITIINRLRRRQPGNARMILNALLNRK